MGLIFSVAVLTFALVGPLGVGRISFGFIRTYGK